MSAVFADTFYWIALANPKDEWHSAAVRCSAAIGNAGMVTTEEVLAEFLAFFSRHGPFWRVTATRLVRIVLSNPGITVIPQSHDSFVRGLSLYELRSDKQYSLVDCISMHTMRERHLAEVLSHDLHFEQEGFTLLLNRDGA